MTGERKAALPRELYDLDLERALLGGLSVSDWVKDQVAGLITPDDFWHEGYRALYAAILATGDGEFRPDPALAPLLARAETCSGLALINPVPLAHDLADLARRRRWSQAAGQIVAAAYNGGDPAAVARQAVDADRPAGRAVSTWADLESRLSRITWAWPGWLPNGFLTLVAGEQESGKSILALSIAACFLGVPGLAWPDGTPAPAAGPEPGAVVWCEAESGQGLNLHRVRHWGLPGDRIRSPLADPLADFRLDHPGHLAALDAAARDPATRLVVLDSLSGTHSRKENDADMLLAVKRLAELARDTGKPVLLTHHLRKRGLFDVGDKITLDRVRGSGAITQLARSVWGVERPDPMRPELRRLAVIKSNLLPEHPGPLAFTIGEQGPRFQPAGDLPARPDEAGRLERAVDLLRLELRAGPLPAADLQERAAELEISYSTLRRAKDCLGALTRRVNGQWHWSLPPTDAPHD